MTRPPRLLVSVLVVAAVLGIARDSAAGCNVIPDPTAQLLSAPGATGAAQALKVGLMQENAKFGGLVQYKGAIGRIDRALFSPQNKDPILVAADGRCVPDKDLPAFAVDRTEDLVAAMIVTPASGPLAAVVATGGKGFACSAVKASSDKERLAVADCKEGGITPAKDQANVLRLTLPPAPAAARAAKIVLFRATTADDAAKALSELAAKDCASHCGDTPRANVGVCIDKIYAPTGINTAQLVVYGVQDMVKCAATNTPNPIPWNTFAAQCKDGDGSGPPMPACQNPPTASTLNMWEDDCYGVYVPFKYDALLGTAPDKWERQVQGQTALTQLKGPTKDRIWIPGAEFVGTLAEADVTGSGTGFLSDPRRAQLDVWFPTDQEWGVRGIIDKPEAILHVVPQLKVTMLCANKPDEACMAVPTVPSLDATRCACRDRYGPDCQCEPTVPARYFQCSTSNMPCTRHAHCNPGELCNKQPTCQDAGTVWKKGGPNPDGPDKCWHEGHCTGTKKQCGFLLFNVRDMRETGKSDVVLDAKLVGSGARKRRGVCKDTGTPSKPRKVCNNSSGNPACAADEGDCAEYVIEALGGTKIP